MSFVLAEAEAVLFDAKGNVMAPEAGAAAAPLPGNQGGLVLAAKGIDGRPKLLRAQNDGAVERLAVDAAGTVSIGSVAPEDPSLHFAALATESGGSERIEQAVGTLAVPVDFVVNADPVQDVRLSEVRVVMTANNIDFDGETFGDGAGILTNGFAILLTVNNGAASSLITVRRNEDLLRFASSTGLNAMVVQGGIKHVLVSSFVFGGNTLLKAGTSDNVTVRVQDDMTPSPRRIAYLTATVYGVKA